MESMQDKRCIYAQYKLRRPMDLFLLYPKYAKLSSWILSTGTPCHKQRKGSILCGYYICEFLRVNGRYCKNYGDLPKFPKGEREQDDEAIQNIQRDMCYFIHH
uniref:Uncharacterized protein n=1 Tax=Oryza punctata TaxID=4537 RepID=A0A0E0LB77_ORYPU